MSSAEEIYCDRDYVCVSQPKSPQYPDSDNISVALTEDDALTLAFDYEAEEKNKEVGSSPTINPGNKELPVLHEDQILPYTPPAPRHSIYYFQDQMTVFLVEGKLFKVHRWFLNKYSMVLQSLFDQPSSNSPDGKTDQTAIPLENVTCEEFESLLNFFYLGMFNRQVLLNEWIALLSVSTTFRVEEGRRLAIEQVSRAEDRLSSVEKIVLGTKHSVSGLFYEAYVELCQRSEALTESEGTSLGLGAIVKILRAREEYRSDRGRPISTLVEEIFGLTLVKEPVKSAVVSIESMEVPVECWSSGKCKKKGKKK